MFLFHYCIPINNYSFNEKIDISKKKQYIRKYSLYNKGVIKEYWINNIKIINDNLNIINDKSIIYKDNFLIQEFTKQSIQNFQFYHSDTEYEYVLYESVLNNIIIRLKEFKNCMTLEFECNHTDEFFNFYNEKNNIL